MSDKNKNPLLDIQNQSDSRNIPLKKVGVRNLEYPITVLDKENGTQHTAAIVNLFADLPHNFKGTHMSRFIEIFDMYRKDISMPRFLTMLEEVRISLDAETTYGDVDFTYFIEKKAPITKQRGMMSYKASYSARVSKNHKEFFIKIIVPIQTVCPCSKAISEFGAHNQRGLVTVTVKSTHFFWLEDLIAIIEDSGSCGVYSVLKREDEKYVTEKAYDNPRFVEDVVREAYLKISAFHPFQWFSIEAENYESIHNHSAYAYVEGGTELIFN